MQIQHGRGPMISRAPSLSGLGHVVACPGSASLPRQARVGARRSDLGTAIHKLVEHIVEGYEGAQLLVDDIAALNGLAPDDAGRLAFLAAHIRLPVPAGALAETSLGMFLPTRDVEVTPCTAQRIEGGAGSYPDVGQDLSGQLDIMWAEPEALTDLLDGEWLCQPDSSLWVVDIKTGDEANVPPVDRNWQLRGAALMAARWTGATRVIPAIVFVNAAECAEARRAGRVYEGRWEVGAPLDALALDEIETEIRAALARAARGESDGLGVRDQEDSRGDGGSDQDARHGRHDADGESSGGAPLGLGLRARSSAPALILGPHCEHCDSRAPCPAFGAEARNLIRLEMLAACVEDGSLTPKGVSYLAGILPALKSTIARAEEAVRAHAEAHGPVLLADGREYGPALEEVTTFKTQETFDALAAVVGEDEANKAAEFTAAGIKRALDGAPRGAFSALMKDVEARGGLVRGAREVWRKRWPAKPVEVVSDGNEEQSGEFRLLRERGAGRADVYSVGERQQGAAEGGGLGDARGEEGDQSRESARGERVRGEDARLAVDQPTHGVKRALCSVCDGIFSVTKAGRMRRHSGATSALYCADASGASPMPARWPA